MRNSNLLKWAQNMNNKSGKDAENRNWIHPPEALSRGHIAYLVKFLGNLEVDQPKGIEVVKEGIRKLKFNQQNIRKSEGSKLPKVELTISVDGVAIQEPKTKRIMHQYPLHRISYCADDKAERRFFSFIVKETPDSEQHQCFVFLSDKLAEDITLTIGQAFDLAYKRFLEMEAQRRLMVLQARVHSLEAENLALKTRLSELALCDDVASYMRAHNLSDLTRVEVGGANNNGLGGVGGANNNGDSVTGAVGATNGAASSKESGAAGAISNGDLNGTTSLLLNLIDSPSTPAVSNGALVPPVPPRSFQNDLLSDLVLPPGGPSVGRKLEGLLLDDLLEDDEFDPRAHEAAPASAPPGPPLLAPPPPAPNHRRGVGAGPPGPRVEDVFGLTPFNDKGTAGGSVAKDPFGMGDFGLGGVGSVNSTGGGGVNAPPGSRDLESAIGLLDRRILEMKDGFSRGLSIGTEDFSIESLDPLRK